MGTTAPTRAGNLASEHSLEVSYATKRADRRIKLRETFWKGSEHLFWNRKANDGYSTIPRLLSLVAALIKEKAEDDPSRVYYDLWCRVWGDEGIVTDIDEDDFAYSSGYTGTRAKRTWTKHIWQLEKLKFIKVAPDGNRAIGTILMLDPLKVCHEMHGKGEVSPSGGRRLFVAPERLVQTCPRRANQRNARPFDSRMA